MKTVDLKNGKPNSHGAIGEALRAAREKIGMTQAKLAETSGIHRQWLGRWERGRAVPSQIEWQKLATILSLDLGASAKAVGS